MGKMPMQGEQMGGEKELPSWQQFEVSSSQLYHKHTPSALAISLMPHGCILLFLPHPCLELFLLLLQTCIWLLPYLVWAKDIWSIPDLQQELSAQKLKGVLAICSTSEISRPSWFYTRLFCWPDFVRDGETKEIKSHVGLQLQLGWHSAC